MHLLRNFSCCGTVYYVDKHCAEDEVMTDLENEWTIFEKTGRIDAYLAYRARKARQVNDNEFEAGEDFGIDKDCGRCDQNGQIRRNKPYRDADYR